MNKEIELLRIFRVAAESSSFRDAAVRLSTSPQGVTRAIQQLSNTTARCCFIEARARYASVRLVKVC